MSITLYGIPNCDTVKKARTWLTEHGLDYRFHDFNKEGVPAERLDAWLAAIGQPLVNRKGTSWRKLDAAAQAAAEDSSGARQLLLAHPSVIKRPVVEWHDGRITVGFNAEDWGTRAQG